MRIRVSSLLPSALIATALILFVYDQRNKNVSQSIRDAKVTKVIILSSNPRSGSTYLSELIAKAWTGSARNSGNMSYWYEPLRWVFEEPFLNDNQVRKSHNNNRQRKIVEDSNGKTTLKLRTIANYMACRFTDFDKVVLGDDSRIITFRKPNPGLGITKLSLASFERNQVLKNAEVDCEHSTFRCMHY